MIQLEALRIVVDAASQIISQEGVCDQELDEAIEKICDMISRMEHRKNNTRKYI